MSKRPALSGTYSYLHDFRYFKTTLWNSTGVVCPPQRGRRLKKEKFEGRGRMERLCWTHTQTTWASCGLCWTNKRRLRLQLRDVIWASGGVADWPPCSLPELHPPLCSVVPEQTSTQSLNQSVSQSVTSLLPLYTRLQRKEFSSLY